MWDWKHLNSNVCTHTNKRPYWKRLLFNAFVLLRKYGGTTASCRKLVCVHKHISISFHIIDREDWNATLKFMWWVVDVMRSCGDQMIQDCLLLLWTCKIDIIGKFYKSWVQHCKISFLIASYTNVCHQCKITPSSQLTVMVNCFGDLS